MTVFNTRLVALASLVLGLHGCHNAVSPDRVVTWTALSAGLWYSCGITSEAKTFCWGGVPGYRDPIPLKDSLMPMSAIPLRIPSDKGFIDITVGEDNMCALDSLRVAYCWGSNQTGDVGDSSYLAKRGPSRVLGAIRWRALAGGSSHVCGVTLDGAAYCWGNQFRGALGNGKADGSSPQPELVLGGLTFTTVRAGPGYSCALTPPGEAYCWGVNDYGLLGDSQPPAPFLYSTSPSHVTGGHRFVTITLGGLHACAIAIDARAYCWGWNNYGQLGNGSSAASSWPVPVSGDLRFVSLTAGYLHTCGLTADGAGYCWGNNERGQFGTGDTVAASTPQLIASPGTYVTLVAGGRHTCARTPSGDAFCWGRGDYGQLGDGLLGDRQRPTPVAPP